MRSFVVFFLNLLFYLFISVYLVDILLSFSFFFFIQKCAAKITNFNSTKLLIYHDAM
jgi:hypothetical protein